MVQKPSVMEDIYVPVRSYRIHIRSRSNNGILLNTEKQNMLIKNIKQGSFAWA